MTYPNTYGDERALAFCALCGGVTDTRDHVPSKVLLDDPVPPQAAVVRACAQRNNGLAPHEEYVACAVDVALTGTTEPDRLRPKVRAILEHSPALASQFAESLAGAADTRRLLIAPERVAAVLTKLAQGHALHELHEPRYLAPSRIQYAALHTLSPKQREAFEAPARVSVWPEVGSRAMQRLAEEGAGWIVVQPGRYRFLGQTGGPVVVRMVLSEYLATEVLWDQ
jgi:hypothetical protein